MGAPVRLREDFDGSGLRALADISGQYIDFTGSCLPPGRFWGGPAGGVWRRVPAPAPGFRRRPPSPRDGRCGGAA